MSNKKNGTAFEKEFALLLSRNGFWVHLLRDNHNGQPFDVIAVKSGQAYAFDCKDCKNNLFALSRIEENQKFSMQLWRECGNCDGMFALKLQNGVRLLSYTMAMKLIEMRQCRMTGHDIQENTISFEEWLKDESYN